MFRPSCRLQDIDCRGVLDHLPSRVMTVAEHLVRYARDGRTMRGELTAVGQRGLPVRSDKAAS